MASEFIRQLLHVSLSASVIIAPLLLAVPLLRRKYRARWRYLVWLVLCIRLLIPFSLPLPAVPLPARVPPAPATVEAPAPQPGRALEEASPGAALAQPTPLQPGKGGGSPLQWAFVIWLAGAAAFAALHFTAHARFCRRLRYSPRHMPSPRLREAWQEAGAACGLSRLPGIGVTTRRCLPPSLPGC